MTISESSSKTKVSVNKTTRLKARLCERLDTGFSGNKFCEEMHLVACSCLNVKIFTKTDLKQSKLVVLDHVPQHKFFKEHSIREVILHIQGIQIEHKFLTERTKLDGWMIYRCINCATLTHAKHLDNDRILVNYDLLSEKSEVEKLKSSPNYSNLYKIIIKKPAGSNTKMTVPDNIRSVMELIQSNYENYIKKEEIELDCRIKKFEAAEREKFDDLKLKAMQEKNTLLSIIVNNDLMKDQDESDFVGLTDSTEKDTPLGNGAIKTYKETGSKLPSHILDEINAVDVVEVLPSSPPAPIVHLPQNKLFGTLNREYSPVLSPLTFGVSNVIPEEDENDENNDEIDGEETDDENESDAGPSKSDKYSKEAPRNGNAVLRRTDLRLPLKPEKKGVAIPCQKCAGQVGKLLKRDADKGSVGSLDPEDVFYFNGDSDDQKFDMSTNFTSDEDEILQNDNMRKSSALFSTSVPIKVPVPMRQNSRGVEIVEDIPADAESMAASILALARSCHGDNEIFGELPRPRIKTPRLQHSSLGRSSEEPPLAI